MRLVLSILLMFSLLLCCKAQDVIYLTNGDSISAKVFRIDSGSVKYLLADTIGARIHSVKRDSVNYISYANGSIYTLPPKTHATPSANGIGYREKQLQHTLLIAKQNRMRIAGLSCMGVSLSLALNTIILIPTGIGIEKRNPDVASGLFLTGGLSFMASIPTGIIGGVYLRKARKAKVKLEQDKLLLSFAPYSQATRPAGNIYGMESGIALRINF